MSMDGQDKQHVNNGDSDDDRGSDNGGSNNLDMGRRSGSPAYDTRAPVTYHQPSAVPRNNGSEYRRSPDVLRTNGSGFEPTSETKITRSAAETERYLQSQGIDFCRNPTVIRRTISGQPVEYQQRVCLRYLHPPAPPEHGPLTIKKIIKAGPPGPPLVIREQPQIVGTPQGALILRERPPRPPEVLPPETRTEYETSGSSRRSVIIEKYPAIEDKSRDIIIEKWLPYEPQRERQVRIERIVEDSTSPTCTEIHYENAGARFSRRFVVIDVLHADPDDYEARHRGELLDSRQLLHEARGAGVTEDITSPATLPSSLARERKQIEYRNSKYIECECFSTVVNTPDNSSTVIRSNYGDASGGFAVSTTTTTERRSNYKSSSEAYSLRDGGSH